MEMVILMGLQASGKSTFYRARFAATHDWVSKDRLRNNRNPARRQRVLLEEAMAAGRSVVVDNTNVTRADRAELIALARSAGATVVGYFFESVLAECQTRNRLRTGKECVPDVALYVTLRRLEHPTRAEGYDSLFFVRHDGANGFTIRDWEESDDAS